MDTAIQTTAGVEAAFSLSDYFPILIYLVIVLLFAIGTLFLSHFLFVKPRKETAVKMMPYESGMDPIGSARLQFDIRFNLIAILFLVFDVELLFLYPWAVVAYTDLGDPLWRNELTGGMITISHIIFLEILVFLGTLGIAYFYAWRKGVFQWR